MSRLAGIAFLRGAVAEAFAGSPVEPGGDSVAVVLVEAAISRSREFGADRGGAELAGSPHGLASALQKLELAAKHRPLPANPATAHLFIVQPFAGQGIVSLFSTHPATQERIARLLGR